MAKSRTLLPAARLRAATGSVEGIRLAKNRSQMSLRAFDMNGQRKSSAVASGNAAKRADVGRLSLQLDRAEFRRAPVQASQILVERGVLQRVVHRVLRVVGRCTAGEEKTHAAVHAVVDLTHRAVAVGEVRDAADAVVEGFEDVQLVFEAVPVLAGLIERTQAGVGEADVADGRILDPRGSPTRRA